MTYELHYLKLVRCNEIVLFYSSWCIAPSTNTQWTSLMYHFLAINRPHRCHVIDRVPAHRFPRTLPSLMMAVNLSLTSQRLMGKFFHHHFRLGFMKCFSFTATQWFARNHRHVRQRRFVNEALHVRSVNDRLPLSHVVRLPRKPWYRCCPSDRHATTAQSDLLDRHDDHRLTV